MAEELLDRILSEIPERLRDSRAAFEESRRMEAALAALDHRPAARARPGHVASIGGSALGRAAVGASAARKEPAPNP